MHEMAGQRFEIAPVRLIAEKIGAAHVIQNFAQIVIEFMSAREAGARSVK
jgi:hypothetical protein